MTSKNCGRSSSESLRGAGSYIDELKDSKAKAGSGVNRSPDLTGDIDTLGSPAEATTTDTYQPKSTGRMPGPLEGNLQCTQDITPNSGELWWRRQ